MGYLTTSCDVDPGLFPFDCQSCYIILRTWTYKGSEMKFLTDVQSIPFYYPDMNERNSFWNLINVGVETFPLDQNLILVPGYKLVFDIQRKPKFYTIIIIGPASILSLLTLATFFIPVDEGERVSYGMSLFLADTVFLLNMADHLPPVSNKQYPILGR